MSGDLAGGDEWSTSLSMCSRFVMIYRRVILCTCLVPQLMLLMILNVEYFCLCP